MSRLIDATPTWAGLMPALLAMIRNGSDDSADAAAAELTRLAEAMDGTIAEQRAEDEAERTPRDRFEAVIWTHDPETGEPVTVGVFESVALDVAAYGAAGHHPAGTDLAAFGSKLTERKARAYGAGWPARLTYRR